MHGWQTSLLGFDDDGNGVLLQGAAAVVSSALQHMQTWAFGQTLQHLSLTQQGAAALNPTAFSSIEFVRNRLQPPESHASLGSNKTWQ